MKHLLIILLSLLLLSAFSQVYTTSSKRKSHSQSTETRPGLFISIGLDKDFINNPALNAWTASHFNTTIKPNIIGGSLELGFVGVKYNGGVQLTLSEPFSVAGFYWGRRILRINSFRTFINLHIGDFNAGNFNTFAPLNYTLSPSQIGKNMVLQYNNVYFALSLKNIFKTKISAKDAFLLNSVEIKFSYMPFKGDWEYGYYQSPNKYLISTRVTGIPSFPSYFISVIYCLGIM
jgi:hypothetical protein